MLKKKGVFMKRHFNFAVALCATALVGILAPASTLAVEEAAIPASPTFTKDVLPILQERCQSCHRPGTSAPMSLLTYEETRPWVRSIKQKVLSRAMPPWFSDPTVGHYDQDPSLTDAQLQTIVRWADLGAPKGNAADAPRPVQWPASNTWEFGEPDIVITSPSVDVPAVGRDLYPWTVAPIGATEGGDRTEDRYVKWIQIIPEHNEVVHHVLVYTSASGAPMGSRTLFANLAKGGSPDLFENGDAKLLAKNTVLHFQIHLHPNGKTPFTERTRVGIKFFPKGYVPKHLVLTKAIQSETTLALPPMESNVRSDSYFTLAQPARLVSFQPHMHYRGKRMTIEAIVPPGEPELLSDINRFVQGWQLTYVYKDSPAFPRGTVLHVTAYHDNSPANKLNPDPTAFVGWGDRTVDEMNIGWVDFYYLTDEDYETVRKVQSRRTGDPAPR